MMKPVRAVTLSLSLSLTLLLTALPIHTVGAITPFVITDIRVEGLERLDAGTVFNYLPLKVGDELNDEEARLSIKELFATGFFKDVALEQDGTALVVKVVERPSISELTISGNNALATESLQQALQQAELVQGRIFNSARLAQVEQEIKDTYLSLGRYSATVTSTVEDQPRNRVAIKLEIDEGRVATIKKVNIIGAKAIPQSRLIKEMSLRDRRGWRLFSRRDQYSKQKLEADIEAIRSYYLDRGFHDFKIVSRSVDISPNKQSIFISISIDEGERFAFGETVFEVAGGVEVDGLDALLTIEPGEPFSRKVVNESRAAIAAHFADAGYAFVEVSPVYETDREAGVVKTVFAIEPRQRVYVRKVEIVGNLHTRDQVIRREMRQFEGAWYSAEAVTRSRARLRRLGYFESVSIDTPSVPGTDDQVDVKVEVKERNTGAIAFTLGYSDTNGALFGIEYTQRNLVGTGRELVVKLNRSDDAEVAEVVYVDPYHTPDGISRGITLSNRRVDTDEVNSAQYVVNTTASGVNYKIPIAETNSLNLGFTLEQVEVDATAQTPREFRQAIDEDLADDSSSGLDLLVRVGVSKDERDDFFFPTSGASGAVSLEMAMPGSEHEYYKFNLQGNYYVPLTDAGLAAKIGGSIGYGDGYGDSDHGLPFFRRYFAGGSSSVRGFDGRSLGPLSSGISTCMTENADGTASGCTAIDPDPVGGDQRLLVNAELLFPPFGGEESNDKRFGLFIDGGTVFGPQLNATEDPEGTYNFREEDSRINFSDMRYSAGVVFNWFSPIGPFSLNYAVPLNDEVGDDLEKFQISLGTVFR